MLYPKMNAVRQVFDLNGIWNFKLISDELDRKEQAGRFLKKSLPMPVPSAYNDIYPNREFADHVGEMVYQRTFDVTESMLEGRMVLRFGSAAHRAEVWLNGNRFI